MKKFVQKFLCTTLVALVLSVSILPAFTQAQTQTPAQTQQTPITTSGSAFQSAQTSLPACGLGVVGDGEGTVEGCAVRFFYYVVLYPSAWLASIGGQVFDYFISYTLDADSYRDGGFVEQGWRIVRDIANISFIFILLYVAITFVLGIQTQTAQKLIVNVVLIALVINFSLFMTRAIIDAGNILGRVFYEKIVIENDDLGDTVNYKTLSAGILAYVNPQKLLTQEMFGTKHNPPDTVSAALGNYSNQGASSSSNNLVAVEGSGFTYEVSAGFVILIILVSSFINLAIAWVFFSVAIYFVGRTLGLWIMMIMSPLAFASVSIPLIGANAETFGFKTWLNKTIGLSFLVVVFMFFLYLTIMFLDVVFTTPFSQGGGSTVQGILSVVVPFAAVFFLLVTAKKQAKKMSGEFGSAVGKALKFAVMGAVGGAGLAVAGAGIVGGAALRQTVGRGAAKMAAGADTTKAGGRFIKKYGTKLSQSSFDVRNVKIPKPAAQVLGGLRSSLSYATDGAVSSSDFTTNLAGKGSDKSYKKLKDERVKKKVEDAKLYAAGEHHALENVTHTYDVEETVVDPSGNVQRVKRTVQETQNKITLEQAKKEKMDAERALKEKKNKVHGSEDYSGKAQKLEVLEGSLKNAEQKYNDLLNKKKAGQTVSAAQISTAETAVRSEKAKVKYQKEQIKQVEDMYQAESNAVAKFTALAESAQSELRKTNAEIYNNYAQSLENWAVPQNLNYRGPANNKAASQIRSMADKEESKS